MAISEARSTSQRPRAEPRTLGVTWRSVVLGVVLAPPNCYWVLMMGEVRYSGHPTTVSLFFNVIFTLLVLTGANALFGRLFPRVALSRGELLVVYTLLSLSSAIAGHDGIQMLAPIMSSPFWFATKENGWADLFHKWIPPWLAVSDEDTLTPLFEGHATPYHAEFLRMWLPPALAWSAFIVLMMFVMLCLNVIVRRQWTEYEKLSYPLIKVPLEIVEPHGRLFRDHLMWIGFAIAAGLDILNGLHMWFPQLPTVRTRIYDLHRYFRHPPWIALGWTPISFYPFAVGLGYLLPQEQLFSCWVFYFFWKGERVISYLLGFAPVRWTESAPPYINEQSFGGYMGLLIFSLWAMRLHLRDVGRHLLGRPRPEDQAEPVSYSVAVYGALTGIGLLIAFSLAAGMSLWAACAFFAIYFGLSVVITRIRAELGHPVHDLHFAGPDLLIPKIVGTKHMRGQDLTMLSFYFWCNRAHRNHPMPHQLEGFKLAEETGIAWRRLFYAMILASIVGALASFWAYADAGCRLGVTAKWTGAARHFGRQPFQRLQGWLLNPQGTDIPSIIAILVGVSFVVSLMFLRGRFVGWPLHPVGYAVSSSWSMNCLWLPLFIAWACKSAILRYGGLRTYRRAIPFFIGLVLGEFTVGSCWTLLGIALGRPTYGFWV